MTNPNRINVNSKVTFNWRGEQKEGVVKYRHHNGLQVAVKRNQYSDVVDNYLVKEEELKRINVTNR